MCLGLRFCCSNYAGPWIAIGMIFPLPCIPKRSNFLRINYVILRSGRVNSVPDSCNSFYWPKLRSWLGKHLAGLEIRSGLDVTLRHWYLVVEIPSAIQPFGVPIAAGLMANRMRCDRVYGFALLRLKCTCIWFCVERGGGRQVIDLMPIGLQWHSKWECQSTENHHAKK